MIMTLLSTPMSQLSSHLPHRSAIRARALPTTPGRRPLLTLFTALTALETFTPPHTHAADEADTAGTYSASSASSASTTSSSPTREVKDKLLAYSFAYPVSPAFPLIFSRTPERYSSAAPLSADARQRIVCELVALPQAVTLSVSVGPPNAILASDTAQWTPEQVAAAVLIDKSTARVSSGQRVAMSDVTRAEEVALSAVDVRPEQLARVFRYEHRSQV